MTTHKDTAGIIAKLEAASGPDRELDVAIARDALKLPESLRAETNDVDPGHLWSRDIGDYIVPHYTSSIDSALLLVPEGCAWLLGSNKMPGFPPCEMDIYEGRDFIIGNATAPTPALAIVLAALRARAHKGEG